MEYNDINIEQLKSEVLARFGRTLDSPTDYDALSLSITESAGEHISVSTLKRLYGYDKRTTTPRPSTLSALARYAGYAGWSDFVERKSETSIEECNETSNSNKRRQHHAIIAAIVIIIAIGIVVSILPKHTEVSPTPTIDPIEQIRDKWTTLTAAKCDSIRSLRSSCSSDEYIKLVEGFYYPYTFETLRNGLRNDLDLLNIDNAIEQSSIEADIFSHCQEIGINLIRECYRRNDGSITTME
ncbi:MAG: hypothetical protein IJ464_01960 [Alistipes sp.]|nr:hypothetical protein [Alistipes sp.]